MQLTLPIPDHIKAKADRIAAQYALLDLTRSEAERRMRHDYYMREAEKAERGESRRGRNG